MITFAQFIVEETAGKSEARYSWVDHPKHGLLLSKGEFAHQKMMDDHGIDAQYENPARGQFILNRAKKHTFVHHYPGSGDTHTPGLGNHIRHMLKVPRSFGHGGRGKDGKSML